MSNPKRIEELEEVIDLQNNDLMFASVLNSRGSYDSKNVTLATIANYVRNGMEIIPGESGSRFGGYEMIDTTEDGTGIYTAETISQYISDSNKNYLWDLRLGTQGVYGIDEPFEKTLGKDCAIWIWGFVREGIEQGETQVFLNDNVRLYNLECLKQSGFVQFYAKAGQTVKVVQSRGVFCRIFIIPLASGGKYFFDASDPAKFKRGVLAGTGVTPVSNWPTYDNDFIERADGSNHIKVTAPYPMLFAGGFVLNEVSGGNTAINEKNTLYAGCNGSSGLTSNYVCLKEGDVFETDIVSNGSTYWIAYPLLDDGSGSGSSENISCGYETYDLSDSDANYINGETVGNDGFTKRFTRDCEILVTPSTIPTEQGSYGNITVKVDNNVQLPTGLFALGIGNLAQFYVKAGQTLSISRDSGTVKVYSRPLKSGGNFFIDGTEELSEPFIGCGRFTAATTTDTFEFTAPQKTLFIYAEPTGQGTYLNSVKINGVEINWKNSNNSYNYDRLILDTNDKITITINSSGHYMTYCALPLLEA